MKRSQINVYVKQAIDLLNVANFKLPRFAYWSIQEWQNRDIGVIAKTMLGWDITDFGNNDFDRLGAVLFTIRNGVAGGCGTPYAEKVICLRSGQRLPCHYHAVKTEDIIETEAGFGSSCSMLQMTEALTAKVTWSFIRTAFQCMRQQERQWLLNTEIP